MCMRAGSHLVAGVIGTTRRVAVAMFLIVTIGVVPKAQVVDQGDEPQPLSPEVIEKLGQLLDTSTELRENLEILEQDSLRVNNCTMV